MFSTLDVINEESQTRLQLSGELTLDDSRKQHHNITTSFHLVAEAPQHHLDFFMRKFANGIFLARNFANGKMVCLPAHHVKFYLTNFYEVLFKLLAKS
jgi:hypothetical protein